MPSAALLVEASSTGEGATANVCEVNHVASAGTVSTTPRRLRRAASNRRPRARRPDSVPSFQPSCCAASLRLLPPGRKAGWEGYNSRPEPPVLHREQAANPATRLPHRSKEKVWSSPVV